MIMLQEDKIKLLNILSYAKENVIHPDLIKAFNKSNFQNYYVDTEKICFGTALQAPHLRTSDSILQEAERSMEEAEKEAKVIKDYENFMKDIGEFIQELEKSIQK